MEKVDREKWTRNFCGEDCTGSVFVFVATPVPFGACFGLKDFVTTVFRFQRVFLFVEFGLYRLYGLSELSLMDTVWVSWAWWIRFECVELDRYGVSVLNFHWVLSMWCKCVEFYQHGLGVVSFIDATSLVMLSVIDVVWVCWVLSIWFGHVELEFFRYAVDNYHCSGMIKALGSTQIL